MAVAEIEFIINDDSFNISVPLEEGELVFKLSHDDAFTISYIQEMASNGYFPFETIDTIYRVEGHEKTLLFTCDNGETTEENDTEKSNRVTTKENVHCDNIIFTKNYKNTEWTDEETRMLLVEYDLHVSRVGPMKSFKIKKVMWDFIAKNINVKFNTLRTGLQAENRYKTVLKRKKLAVENNSRSGATRMEVPFENELAKISSKDDSIEPELLRSAKRVKILKENTKPTADSPKENTNEPIADSHVLQINIKNLYKRY